ncbi:ATP-binding protein [Streptomyces sp. NPDC094448]|uniref:ATP-binding protein n=1 Tax=Streptomyces sp. NPDC094448 TaxID=3366063 RepID=UPI00381E5C0A
MTSTTDGLFPAETEPAVRHAFEIGFSPDESRVRPIRHLTADRLRHWHLDDLADDAALIVSELVSNAIRYGDGHRITLRVEHRARELRIEVADGTPGRAVARTAGNEDEGGRGLLLVAALAREWGTSSGGETTWCVLAVPAEAPGPPVERLPR